jgi:hypothetical protein
VLSRTLGDAIFGDFFPSQVVVLFLVTIAGEAKFALVVAAVLSIPAAIAVTWSAELRGHYLVGTVLGVPVQRILLVSGTIAYAESVTMARGTTTLIRLDDVVVETGRSIDGEGSGVRLGYTRFMGARRTSQWIQAINAAKQ